MKKISADKIFDGFRFLNPNSVLLIEDDGTINDVIETSETMDNVDHLHGILSPGFINCHCHLELSHMKGHIPENTGLIKFVTDVVQQRNYPEEEILAGIEKAENEMVANGIVAVGDICNNTLTIPQKLKGRIYYHNFIEASGFDPAIAESRFERSRHFFAEYARYYSIPVESNSIVPHAAYSVSDNLWDMIVNFPGNHLLTIHNQETVEENEWFETKTGAFTHLYENLRIDTDYFVASGKTSLQSYLHKFLRNQSVIMVHNVHTNESDLAYCQLPTADCQLFWCFCPNANMYITGNLPDVNLFLKQNCKIVLGTDSLASNNELSILSEIKTLKKKFPELDMETLLTWATSNGAKALELDLNLGSFEKGKQPGILLIENDFSKVKRIL